MPFSPFLPPPPLLETVPGTETLTSTLLASTPSSQPQAVGGQPSVGAEPAVELPPLESAALPILPIAQPPLQQPVLSQLTPVLSTPGVPVSPVIGAVGTAKDLRPLPRPRFWPQAKLAQTPAAPPAPSPSVPQVPQDVQIIIPARPTPSPSVPGTTEPLQTSADRQEYDQINQVFTAIGNVLLQFRQAQLQADQVETNVNTQVVVANGNVRLTRDQQTFQGQYLEYNLLTDRGSFTNVSGVINLSSAQEEPNRGLTTNPAPNSLSPLPDQLGGSRNQPNRPGPTTDPSGAPRRTSGIQQLRFTAERIEFNAGRWVARNIRITNDPFDPPELELRATQASLVRISPTDDLVTVRNGRIVFDQRVAIPLLRNRVVISRRRRDILPFDFGYDNDRGGLFVGRNLELIDKPGTSLVVNPQFFLQRAVGSSFNLSNLNLYGGTVRFFNQFSPKTSVLAFARFTSLDPNEIEDKTRANFRFEQLLGQHRLGFEGSLRERLFNGSFGEQNVRSSLGVVLDSPTRVLGDTGLQFSYQFSTRYITAATRESRNDDDPGDPISLFRLQGVASLRRDFTLWRGQALPPTATQGLRYTSKPVEPYVQMYTGVTAASNNYSNGDTQQALAATVGLEAQFGRFSKSFLDSTSFRVSYSQVGNIGFSPFLFDRVADNKILSFGFLQQIYGPLRAGVQGSLNLDSGQVFNTDLIVEYSRRTYGVVLRYSPDRQAGSFQLRINGFNWRGNPDPLLEPNVGTVEGGVVQPARPDGIPQFPQPSP
jgi:hypothetical protein